jgi:hypothetical protein
MRHNRYVIVRNPRDPGRRRFLIRSTDGGRVLTLVIEQTASRRERLRVGRPASAQGAERAVPGRRRT